MLSNESCQLVAYDVCTTNDQNINERRSRGLLNELASIPDMSQKKTPPFFSKPQVLGMLISLGRERYQTFYQKKKMKLDPRSDKQISKDVNTAVGVTLDF